jgi:hypothetical protein
MSSGRTSIAALLLLLACPSPDTGDSEPTSEACADCALGDEHIVPLQAEITALTVPLAEGQDALLDWSQVQQGMMQTPLAGIDRAWLFVFDGLAQDEILGGLASASLDQSAVSNYMSCASDQGRCLLTEFEILGHWLVPERDFLVGSGTWLVALEAGEGAGFQQLLFLEPDPHSASVEHRVGDDDAHMSAQVALEERDPLLVEPFPALDWSGCSRDVHGNELTLRTLDRLVIQRFDLSLAELEQGFLQRDQLAEQAWELDVAGVDRVDLSVLDEQGFPGFDSESRWLVSLSSSADLIASPRLVVIVRAVN